MATKYDIKRLTNPKDHDFGMAMNIYLNDIDPKIYTNSNDIAYWLENYQKFRPDELFILGLYINNRIVGFAQFVYLAEEKLIFVDYMAIKSDHRGNNSFYEFVAQIKEFLEKNNIHYAYIVIEYPYMNHGSNEPSDESKRFIRLLKLLDFGVIKAAYFQPAHGLANQESFMRSTLMIYSKKELKEIKRETYLNIVRAMLYKHYYRWYEPIERDIMAYKKHLDGIFEKISADVNKNAVIKINGYKREEPPVAGPAEKRKVPYLLFGLFITLLAIVMAVMNRYFEITVVGVIAFWVLSLMSFFALVAVFGNSKSALHIFDTLVKPLGRFFGKSK